LGGVSRKRGVSAGSRAATRSRRPLAASPRSEMTSGRAMESSVTAFAENSCFEML
jgi:hypothetical protein